MLTSGDENILKIRNIANCSDEVIKMFSKTPIKTLLKQRREYCRIILEKNLLERDDIRMLEMYDKQISNFFEIYNYEK